MAHAMKDYFEDMVETQRTCTRKNIVVNTAAEHHTGVSFQMGRDICCLTSIGTPRICREASPFSIFHCCQKRCSSFLNQEKTLHTSFKIYLSMTNRP